MVSTVNRTRGEMLEQEVPASISGTASNPDDIKEGEKVDHHLFWNRAIDDAIDKAKANWGPGDFNVAIHQYARIRVWNPGKIVDYVVVLTKTS